MKKLWKRIPKRVKLGMDLVLILVLLFAIWAMDGFPTLTRKGIYHRALQNALLPAASNPELAVELGDDCCFIIGADSRQAYRVTASRSFLNWRIAERALARSAEDGVWAVPLTGRVADSAPEQYIPGLAVKVPGAAELEISVEVDVSQYYDVGKADTWEPGTGELITLPGGLYPMRTEHAENGWFLACFDTAPVRESVDSGTGEISDLAARNYFIMLNSCLNPDSGWEYYPEWQRSFCFHILARDERGAVIRDMVWNP